MKRLAAKTLLVAATVCIIACLLACTRTDQIPHGPSEKVTIAYATLPETAIAQVAQAKGYFRDEGLEVAPHLHQYGKRALSEVLEGKADFATVAETPVMFAIMNGEKISVVATIQSSSEGHAVVARRDRGILALKDLARRRIGATLGTTAEFFLDALLATNGISGKDIELVDLQPEELRGAIADGRVDAVCAFYPFLRQVQKELGANGITFHDKDIYTETFNVVATQDFIRSNPGKIRKMLRALISAENFIVQHPAEAQEAVSGFSRTDIAIIRDLWDKSILSVSLEQSLLLALEDETRWAIRRGLTGSTYVPNYLDFIYLDGLISVKPKAVRILR